MSERIAIVGLGYVGLPLALALARKFPNTVGFDINQKKIDELNSGIDRTGEVTADDLKNTTLKITANTADMQDITMFIVAVPTPIDDFKNPDLSPVRGATKTVASVLKPGAVVVYESTVWPGVTEDICGPLLEQVSGLKQGTDFKLGYSPERINPGDKLHTLEKIVKIVSAEDEESLDRVYAVYDRVIEAGLHRASSIKVAEAAKVIENTQRDLNIALMNELALIFDKLGIRTRDVLEAAGTKWNFLKFSPGLVGGHCIGVDPYYLTAIAQKHGYHPHLILAGRRLNDGMGAYMAQRLIKMLFKSKVAVKDAKIAILGLTFKENVPDLRNSRVPDIVQELAEYGITPLIHDAVAEPHEAEEEYGVHLASWDDLKDLDGVIVAVAHNRYIREGVSTVEAMLKPGGVLIDVKSLFKPEDVSEQTNYWSL